MSDWLREAKELFPYTKAIRRLLHENPELTARELKTVAFIKKELEKEEIPYENIPDGGVLAWLDGKKESENCKKESSDREKKSPDSESWSSNKKILQTVLLRADCDALPIQESPLNASFAKECVSKVSGVMHACGHDAHTAMLLTAAKILKKNLSSFDGRIVFLFERGEEGGNCIYYVLKWIEENDWKIDACYGIHTDLSLPTGTYGIRSGCANSGNVNFEIKLTGKTGHGSRPDLANNPIDCFLAIGNALKDLRMKYISPDTSLTYNIGSVKSGEKRNIVPETLTFLGTVRFHDRKAGYEFKEKMHRMICDISHAYECTAEFVEFTGPSFPVYNELYTVEIGKKAAKELVGEEKVKNVPINMGSESFASLAAFYPSAFFRLGIRNEEKGITVSGHQPEFDIDEDGMPYGAALYAAIAVNWLSKYREKPEGFEPFEGDADDFLNAACRQVPHRYDREYEEGQKDK